MKTTVLLLGLAILLCAFPEVAKARASSPLGEGFEMVVQHGHNDDVASLIFVDGGRLLVTGSHDGTVKVWDVAERILLRNIKAHRGSITRVILHPDGEHVITAATDDLAGVWNFRTGERRGLTVLHNYSPHIDLSADGTWFASGDSSTAIRIWSFPACELLRTFRLAEGEETWAIRISPDGSRIAVNHSAGSGDDEGLRVLDAATGETVKNFRRDGCDGYWFSRDGSRLVTCFRPAGSDLPENASLVEAWDASTLERVGEIPAPAYLATPSGDGKTLAVVPFVEGKVRQVVRFHRFDDFAPEGELEAGRFLNSIVFDSRDGWLAAECRHHEKFVSDEDYTTRLFDLSTGKERCHYDHGDTQLFRTALCVEKNLTALGGTTGAIELRSLAGEQPATVFKPGRGYLSKVITSRDETVIVVGTGGGRIILWNLKTLGRIGSFRAHERSLTALAIDGKGRTLFSGDAFGSVHAWHLPEGRLKRTFTGQGEKEVMALAVNTTGTRLCVTTRAFKAHIFDLETGEMVGTPVDVVGSMITPSADGKTFGAYHNEGSPGLTVISAETGELVEQRGGYHYGQVAYFGFDESFERAVGFSGRVKLWNGQTRRLIDVYDGFDEGGHCFTLHRTGGLLAAGHTFDYGIRVYDVANRKQAGVFTGHSDMIEDVHFTHSGRHLLSVAIDGTVRVWNVKTGRCATLIEDGEDWVAFSESGLFDASANGGRLVPIVAGLKPYGMDQFATRLNRPDLLLETLGLGDPETIAHYARQHERRLRRLGVAADADLSGMHVPEARIEKAAVEGKRARLSLAFSDAEHPLIRYDLFVNDVPVFGSAGKRASGQSLEVSETVELGLGRNKIEVSCMNGQGAESFRALTFAEYDETVSPDLYYVGFGVSDYADDALDLGYAHQDALDLATTLRGMGSAFGEVHVRTFVNGEVLKGSIAAARAFLERAGVDDTVVLFIAGHGMHVAGEKGGYYYLTHNTDMKDIAGTAAPFELIEALLQGIAPRSKLLLIDTCESGELEEDLVAHYCDGAASRGVRARTSRGIAEVVRIKRPETPRRSFVLERNRYIYNDLARRSGAIVFSSSRGNELSYEKDELRNGLFTEEILNGFTGRADGDGDGIVTTDELRAYVIRAVSQLSGDLQHPTVDRDNIYQKFSFPVTR